MIPTILEVKIVVEEQSHIPVSEDAYWQCEAIKDEVVRAYIDGKIGEVMSEDEIKNTIIARLSAAGSIGTDFYKGQQRVSIDITDIRIFAQALSGKVGKQFIPATEGEIDDILHSKIWGLKAEDEKKIAQALVGKVSKPSTISRDELYNAIKEQGYGGIEAGKLADAILRRMGEKE